MQGIIYIAGSFYTVNKSKCGKGKGWIDNDPHFWINPPTWGICRNDLRKKVKDKDYIFYVLPKKSPHKQCLFGYIKVKEIITHEQAYRHPKLKAKRMRNKNPNGNIIVDSNGIYNKFDGNAHIAIFNKIKDQYVIGDTCNSRMLSEEEINRLAPSFVDLLKELFNKQEGTSPIDFISRYGKILCEKQVNKLLEWVNK